MSLIPIPDQQLLLKLKEKDEEFYFDTISKIDTLNDEDEIQFRKWVAILWILSENISIKTASGENSDDHDFDDPNLQIKAWRIGKKDETFLFYNWNIAKYRAESIEIGDWNTISRMALIEFN